MSIIVPYPLLLVHIQNYAAYTETLDELLAWHECRHEHSKSGYAAFFKKFPESRFKALAHQGEQELETQRQQEEAAWQQALAERNLSVFEDFLQQYPNGIYAAKARAAKYDVQAWEIACKKQNRQGYEHYLEDYPNDLYTQEARNARQSVLEKGLQLLIDQCR